MTYLRHLRIFLVILAVAAVLILTIIAGITGYGFEESVSHLFLSVSIASLISATLLGLDCKHKNKFYRKIGISIGLLMVLIGIWL